MSGIPHDAPAAEPVGEPPNVLGWNQTIAKNAPASTFESAGYRVTIANRDWVDLWLKQNSDSPGGVERSLTQKPWRPGNAFTWNRSTSPNLFLPLSETSLSFLIADSASSTRPPR